MQNKILVLLKRAATSCNILSILVLVSVFALGVCNLPQLFYHTYHVVYDEGGSVQEKTSRIQSLYSENFKMKTYFVELNGLVHRVLGQREMKNVYKLDNGQLAFILSEADMMPSAQNIIALRDYLDSMGTPFLYVEAPYKLQEGNEQLPIGVYDFSNRNANNLVNALIENNVDVLDLRQRIAEEQLDYSSLFFTTDIHWKPTTGFWAFQEIVQHINQNNTYTIDPQVTSLTEYHIDTYENYFLGGCARSTGQTYAGLDDFDLIYPKCETEMSISIPARGLELTGSFYDIMFDMSQLSKKVSDSVYPYAAYCWADNPITTITNENAANHQSILLIKDSYSLTIAPFLSQVFSEVTMLDMRWYKDMTAKEYIEQTKPDIVILVAEPYQFDPGMFTFGC